MNHQSVPPHSPTPSDTREDLADTREDLADTPDDPAATRDDLVDTRDDPADTRDDPADTRDNPTVDPRISEILSALPPANTTRWVIRRKANVVNAVLSGAISIKDVCARYGLTTEEFDSWHRLIERHGQHGLRSTRLQEYRDASRRGR